MDNNFMEKIQRAIRQYVNEKHGGNQTFAGKALGNKSGDKIRKWLLDKNEKDSRNPSLTELGPYLEDIGIKVVFPWETDNTNTGCQNCDELNREIAFLKGQIAAQTSVLQMMTAGGNQNKAEGQSLTGTNSSKGEQLSYSFQNEEKKAI